MDFSTISFRDEETKALKEEEEDDDDEALSLSDLPLNPDETPESKRCSSEIQETSRRTSSDQSDFFEFSYDFTSDNSMSHAEDIISCGKLVPYKKSPPPFDDQILRSFSTGADEYSINYSRRYCESLPELKTNRSYSSGTRLTRSSRSLDSKKLRRNSSLVMKSEVSDAHRRFWTSTGKPELPKAPSAKPRWYDWVFGLTLKFPPEIDLRDMKNRQVRRKKQCLPAAEEGGRRFPVDRRGHSWGVDLISVLSCKRHANVAVAHSIGSYDVHNTHVMIT